MGAPFLCAVRAPRRDATTEITHDFRNAALVLRFLKRKFAQFFLVKRRVQTIMPDMLVNLLKLSPLDSFLHGPENSSIQVRRAQPFEITPVMDFVELEFSVSWADEISVGFANKPVSVYVATFDGQVVGFAAYECTRRNFFGPMGVREDMRGHGIGKALLLACLWGLREMGYVYGIIGGVGPEEFYQKTVGATVIAGSTPGIYSDILK